MNIVTICSTNWIDHLDRFLYFAKKAMPMANIHVLLVYSKAQDTTDFLVKVKDTLLTLVKAVRFTTEIEMPGRLMFYDYVRSELLNAFHLTEALYVDVDVDILQDVSDLPTLAPDAEIMACLDPYGPTNSVQVAFKQYDITWGGLNYQIGALYMRQSFEQEFKQLVREQRIPMAGEFMPGSAIWNVILHRHKAAVIPETYHACWQRGLALLTTKIIHFNGPVWQKLRLHCTYPTINPNTLQFNPQPTGRFLLKDI